MKKHYFQDNGNGFCGYTEESKKHGTMECGWSEHQHIHLLRPEEIAENVFSDLFKRYVSPSSKWWENLSSEEAPKGKQAILDRVKELLESYERVEGGYAATSVRGYRTYHIFYK